MVAILRAKWDKQPRVWETSQGFIAMLQKTNSKNVVTFLNKNFKFPLFLF